MKNAHAAAAIRAAGFVEYGRINNAPASGIHRTYIIPPEVVDTRLENLVEIIVRECAMYATSLSHDSNVGHALIKLFLEDDSSTQQNDD